MIAKLLFVCAFALSLPMSWTALRAQTPWNSVCDYPGITGKNLTTIVREYKGEQFVVYADEKSKSFSFVDMSVPLIINAPLLSTISINDFEILNGAVYFCGADGTTPIAGWFDVDSLFNNLSPIRYLPVPPTLACPDPTGTQDIISKLTRITPAVFNGQLHLLLTGEATCNLSPTLNHCLVDVYHNGANWMMAYHQDNMGIYYYDDIEVTATEIVIVGHKENTNGEYMQSYTLPTPTNSDIFDAQITPPPPPPPFSFNKNTYSYGGSDYIPDMHKDILAEWIDSSKFVTVTYGERFVYPNLIQGTFLNIYHSVGNLASRWFISEHCTGNRELRYNSVTNSIMLLFDSCSTSWGDGYVEFQLDPTHTQVTGVEFHSESGGGMYSSLDACPNSQVNGKTVLTGRNFADWLRIWQHASKPKPRCAKDTKLVPTYIPMGPNLHSDDVYYSYQPLRPDQMWLTATRDDLTVFCREKKN